MKYDKHEPQYDIVQMSSTSITDTHRRYSVPELELLGIVFALQHTKYYTSGAENIEIRCGHALPKSLTEKDLSEIDNPRLVYLFEQIIHYNYTRGSQNQAMKND